MAICGNANLETVVLHVLFTAPHFMTLAILSISVVVCMRPTPARRRKSIMTASREKSKFKTSEKAPVNSKTDLPPPKRKVETAFEFEAGTGSTMLQSSDPEPPISKTVGKRESIQNCESVQKPGSMKKNESQEEVEVKTLSPEMDEVEQVKARNKPKQPVEISRPRLFPRTGKEVRIAKGLLYKEHSSDYPTMADVISDWSSTVQDRRTEGSFRESPLRRKAKREAVDASCVPVTHIGPDSSTEEEVVGGRIQTKVKHHSSSSNEIITSPLILVSDGPSPSPKLRKNESDIDLLLVGDAASTPTPEDYKPRSFKATVGRVQPTPPDCSLSPQKQGGRASVMREELSDLPSAALRKPSAQPHICEAAQLPQSYATQPSPVRSESSSPHLQSYSADQPSTNPSKPTIRWLAHR